MRQHLFWLCACLETVLMETREQNMGGNWQLLILWVQGFKSRTLGEEKGCFFPGTEVCF